MATVIFQSHNQVKGTVGGMTTNFTGNYQEWTGSTSTMKRYYYAGAQRVAMRVGKDRRTGLGIATAQPVDELLDLG